MPGASMVTEMDYRLLIVQPYIPTYRVPFFKRLREEAARQGIAVTVASAEARGANASRSDDRSASVADCVLRERRVGVGSKTLLVRSLRDVVQRERPDLIVVEQAIKNLESWPLLVRPTLGGSRVALWGQGRSYSTDASRVERSVKRWLTNRADWFFAYTQTGAQHVIEGGFPAERTTVLWNSTDTTALKAEIADLTAADLRGYRERHGLIEGQVGLFLGGVDERKGIPFLLDAVEAVAQRMDGFTLLVGGSGTQAAMVQERVDAGAPVRYLGRVDGREKALALAVADVVMVPEWVGLVAVDALASGTPVVTTRHPSHSPEFEYLDSGMTAIVVEHDVLSYADAVADLLADEARLARMSASCRDRGEMLSIESMAQRFVDGVVSWRDSGQA